MNFLPFNLIDKHRRQLTYNCLSQAHPRGKKIHLNALASMIKRGTDFWGRMRGGAALLTKLLCCSTFCFGFCFWWWKQ